MQVRPKTFDSSKIRAKSLKPWAKSIKFLGKIPENKYLDKIPEHPGNNGAQRLQKNK